MMLQMYQPISDLPKNANIKFIFAIIHQNNVTDIPIEENGRSDEGISVILINPGWIFLNQVQLLLGYFFSGAIARQNANVKGTEMLYFPGLRCRRDMDVLSIMPWRAFGFASWHWCRIKIYSLIESVHD